MALLPFGILPGHWGITGKTREVMKAEYLLSGFDLDFELVCINVAGLTEDELIRKKLDLRLQYNKIALPQYHRKLAELIKDDAQKTLAILELDWREGNITELVYTKTVATLKKEPWVIVLKMDFGGKSALEGSFELDWNDYFIEKLTAEGYEGMTDDIIVNQWFMEVCRNVAMEEFDGTGNFTSDSEANLDAMKRWSADSVPLANGRAGYK